jgi:AraC-like DNA-binding protein
VGASWCAVTSAATSHCQGMQVHCLFAFCNRVVADHQCARGSHPCTMIDFTIGGSGFLVKDGRRYPFGPASILVQAARDVYWIEQATTGMHICIGLRGCHAENINPGVHRLPASLAESAQEFRRLIAEPQRYSSMRLELLAGLAALTLQELYPKEKATGVAQRARAIMESEIQRPLTIKDLAIRLRVGVDHLREQFKFTYGEAPKRYLHRCRMSAAKELLKTSALAVQDVAKLCGFPNPLYFSRCVHQSTGYSPSQWRRRDGTI